jgi:hypothetical protein
MKKLVRIFSLALLIAIFSAVQPVNLPAQCPMCRMSAETNLRNGGTAGRGLNTGILYMLATPYLLVGVLGFLWWKNRRREDTDEELTAEA